MNRLLANNSKAQAKRAQLISGEKLVEEVTKAQKLPKSQQVTLVVLSFSGRASER
jgi:hypothetical protein